MSEEAELQKIYFVTTALPGPADECVFVEVEDQNGKGMGPAGSGGDWEKHPVHDGLYRLGPFARYGVRHVETQASFEAELRGKDAEIKILEAKLRDIIQVARNRAGELAAELEETRGQRDSSLKTIEAMTPVIEEAGDRLLAKQSEVMGLRKTIDEERANHAAARQNLEGQVVAARAER